MKKVETTLTFAELTAMSPADLFKLAGENAKVNEAVSKAKDKFTNALKPFAKIVAAVKRLYTERREKHEIPLDIPFAKFFKDNAKGDLPGRAEALASLFNSLVLTLGANGKPMLPEEYFDSAAVDWLEKANAIIKAAQKMHGDTAWKTCDDVLDTVNALSKPGDAAKTLREIRKRQKGESSTDGEETAVTMTPQLAAEYLIAALKLAGALPEDKAYELCCLVYDVNTAWAENSLSEETRNAFDKRYAQAMKHRVAAHVEVVSEAVAA